MKRLLFSIVMLLVFATAGFAKVNINTAPATELEALPGVGPANTYQI